MTLMLNVAALCMDKSCNGFVDIAVAPDPARDFWCATYKITTQAAQSDNPGLLTVCTTYYLKQEQLQKFHYCFVPFSYVLVHDMRTWYARTVVSLQIPKINGLKLMFMGILSGHYGI